MSVTSTTELELCFLSENSKCEDKIALIRFYGESKNQKQFILNKMEFKQICKRSLIQSLKKTKSDSKEVFSLQLYIPPKYDIRYLVCYNIETHICKAKSSPFMQYYSKENTSQFELSDVDKIIKDQLISLTTGLAMHISSNSLKIEELTAEWIISDNEQPYLIDLPYISILMIPERPINSTQRHSHNSE
jgi:hypothetical protein